MPITDACDQIWPSGKREAARDEHSSSEHRDLDMSLYALLDHIARSCRPLSYAVRAIFYAARGIFSISKSNTSKFTRGVNMGKYQGNTAISHFKINVILF